MSFGVSFELHMQQPFFVSVLKQEFMNILQDHNFLFVEKYKFVRLLRREKLISEYSLKILFEQFSMSRVRLLLSGKLI